MGLTVNGFYTKLKNIVGQGAVVDSVSGATTWVKFPVRRPSPMERRWRRPSARWRDCRSWAAPPSSRPSWEPEVGPTSGAGSNGVPTSLGNLAVFFAPRRTGLSFKGDWHYVAERPAGAGIALPAYSYFNFGAGFAIVGGARFNVDLLNALQSKGLEEGNPRIATPGASPLFLARPLLPRRLQASIAYDFGGGPPQELR